MPVYQLTSPILLMRCHMMACFEYALLLLLLWLWQDQWISMIKVKNLIKE